MDHGRGLAKTIAAVARGDEEMKKLQASLLTIVALLLAGAAVTRASDDKLSGTWAGDWGPSAADRNPVTVELKWDGKALSGTVNPGPNAVALEKATFDPDAGTVHFEATAKTRSGQERHYKVDGKLEGSSLSGSWNHETRKGDFKISKK